MLAAMTGGVLAGLAVMVRPANLYVAAAWVSGQAILVFSRRIGPRPGEAMRRAAVLALMLIAVAAPCGPQFYNNVVFAKVVTPLVALDLGTLQINGGITTLKAIGGLPPVPAMMVRYINPFANGTRIDPDHPLRWYRENPTAGFKTLLLHAFALLDQDFIFPYVVDLSPVYRLPLAVVNHVGIGLSSCALWLWIRTARRPGRGSPILRFSLPLIVRYILGVFAIHGATEVEPRFGLPLILLAAPLAMTAIRHYHRLPARRLVLPGATIAVYTVIAIAASDWLRSQSPVISNWEHAARNAALLEPTRHGDAADCKSALCSGMSTPARSLNKSSHTTMTTPAPQLPYAATNVPNDRNGVLYRPPYLSEGRSPDQRGFFQRAGISTKSLLR